MSLFSAIKVPDTSYVMRLLPLFSPTGSLGSRAVMLAPSAILVKGRDEPGGEMAYAKTNSALILR